MALNDVAYTDDYRPDFGIPYVPMPPIAELQSWSKEKLGEYLTFREKMEKAANDNPVGAGWILPSWKDVMDNWSKYQNHIILGGNRCLRGDTMIYDPVTCQNRRIDSITGPHHVYSYDGVRRVIAQAEAPFQKPAGMMAEVELSTGQRFVASLEHRVLCANGLWLPVSALRVGVCLFRPQSTWDNGLLGQPPSVQHWIETGQGWPDDYPPFGRLCDARLPAAQDSVQGVSPSLTDVLEYNIPFDSSCRLLSDDGLPKRARTQDGPARKRGYNRAGPLSCLRAIRDALDLNAVRFAGTLSRAFGKPYKSTSLLCDSRRFAQGVRQSFAASNLLGSTDGFLLLDNQFCHGVAYVTHIRLAGIDVKWDMTVPSYGCYEAAGVLHHNSAKSTLASRLVVWAAGTIPNADVRAYHVNEDRSIEDQQRMIWDALPVGIRSLPIKKGMNHSLQYSQKNGFTDNIAILPPIQGAKRGGSIKFGNYRSYQADAQVAEGFKAHVIWGDEEMPQKMFETLQYRTIDYHGRIILTFTTLTGWTPLVQDILGRTRTLKKKYAPLIGKELPVMQESLSRPSTIIYYFWTEDNLFIDTSDFRNKVLGRPRDEILARAYGIPTKSVASVFPGFDKTINVIPHENLPWLKDSEYKVTRYHVIDPAGSKNWFMLWLAVDAGGTWWVYREWPDYDDWALPGNSIEGKAGPAQKGSKKGINDYVELIKNCEQDETIFERIIDPRLGAAEKQSADGATTIISELDDAGLTYIPAPGVEIENGLQLINGLLSYDEKKPISALNAPKLYISDRCTNLIYAMTEYTAKGGKDEATKDPIDCLRYLCVANCEYQDTEKPDEGRTFSY